MKIDNEEGIKRIVIQEEYKAICMYDQNEFTGTITIKFVPTTFYLELIQLRKLIHNILSKETSAEKICYDLHNKLSKIGLSTKIEVSAKSITHPEIIVEK